ncbi:MAG: hypothetical protein ACLFUL_07230 [Desulfobacteraceae bacterium]
MHNLKTVHNLKALLDLDTEMQKVLADDRPLSYTVEPEIAGVAVGLVYEKGALTAASIREDETGTNITLNIKTLLSVPLTLTRKPNHPPPPDLLEVNGMVYMERGAFEKLNQGRLQAHLPPYDTPRDAATASLKPSAPKLTAKRPLDMFCHGARPINGIAMDTQYQLMLQLQQWGLRINRRHLRSCDTMADVAAYCHELRETRDQFFYEVDGAIINIDSLHVQKKLHQGSKHPEESFIYKFTHANPAQAHG